MAGYMAGPKMTGGEPKMIGSLSGPKMTGSGPKMTWE